MRATVDLRATFDYTDEVSYAESLVELMQRVRECCAAEVLTVRRDEGAAHESYVLTKKPAPTLPNPNVGIKTGRPTR